MDTLLDVDPPQELVTTPDDVSQIFFYGSSYTTPESSSTSGDPHITTSSPSTSHHGHDEQGSVSRVRSLILTMPEKTYTESSLLDDG